MHLCLHTKTSFTSTRSWPIDDVYCRCWVKYALTALIVCSGYGNNKLFRMQKYMHGYSPVHIISRRPIL